jgi:hypothetical protein
VRDIAFTQRQNWRTVAHFFFFNEEKSAFCKNDISTYPGTQNNPETIPHGVKVKDSLPVSKMSHDVAKHMAVL